MGPPYAGEIAAKIANPNPIAAQRISCVGPITMVEILSVCAILRYLNLGTHSDGEYAKGRISGAVLILRRSGGG